MVEEFKNWLSEQKYDLYDFSVNKFTWKDILRVSKMSSHLSHLTWNWKIINDE